jgi:hypothetical protein
MPDKTGNYTGYYYCKDINCNASLLVTVQRYNNQIGAPEDNLETPPTLKYRYGNCKIHASNCCFKNSNVVLSASGGQQVVQTLLEEGNVNSSSSSSTTGSPTSLFTVHQTHACIDTTAEMYAMVQEKALLDLSSKPKDIAMSVHRFFNQKYMDGIINSVSTNVTSYLYMLILSNIYCHICNAGLHTGMTTNSMENLVRNTRTKQFQSLDEVIFSPALRTCLKSDRNFILFDTKIFIESASSKKSTLSEDQKYQRMIGWGHFELMHLMRYDAHYFIDCTFKCVPKNFVQCMIIMIFDEGTQLYVPIFYILLQSKFEEVYTTAINLCAASSPGFKKAKSVTCDFERGLMNAIDATFPEKVAINGCEFHFKQATRRKLQELRIPVDTISKLVNKDGLLNLLTQISISEIVSKGIPYIRSHFEEHPFEESFDKFWKYFTKTWITFFRPELWNVNAHINNDMKTMNNRTNNALERFNRKLNEQFSCAHPCLANYIEVIREVSQEYVDIVKSTQARTTRLIERDEPHIYEIPDDYYTYTPTVTINSQKSSKSKINSFETPIHVQLLHYEPIVLNQKHYDREDRCMMIVYKIQVEKWKGRDEIMCYRREFPTSTSPQISSQLAEDKVSIEDVCQMSGIPLYDGRITSQSVSI